MNLAPVVLFVYKRLLHTQQSIEALRKNQLADQSDLIIFCDGPETTASINDVQNVKNYLKTISGFKSISIIEQLSNKGLANSIIEGVTSVINRYGKVIVLEDDLVTSPFFLKYMNQALEFYQNSPAVFSISGYNHSPELMPFPTDYEFDVYCNVRNSSWGWATWNNRWRRADWDISDFSDFSSSKSKQLAFNCGGEDMVHMLSSQMKGEIASWAIRWSYTHFKNHAVSICPVLSYVHNIGHDGSGEHCDQSDRYNIDLEKAIEYPQFTDTIFIDNRIMTSFRKIYRKENIHCKIMNFMTKIFLKGKVISTKCQLNNTDSPYC